MQVFLKNYTRIFFVNVSVITKKQWSLANFYSNRTGVCHHMTFLTTEIQDFWAFITFSHYYRPVLTCTRCIMFNFKIYFQYIFSLLCLSIRIHDRAKIISTSSVNVNQSFRKIRQIFLLRKSYLTQMTFANSPYRSVWHCSWEISDSNVPKH